MKQFVLDARGTTTAIERLLARLESLATGYAEPTIALTKDGENARVVYKLVDGQELMNRFETAARGLVKSSTCLGDITYGDPETSPVVVHRPAAHQPMSA